MKIGGRVDEVHSPRCTTAVGLVMYGRQNKARKMQADLSLGQQVKMWFKKIM
jgi:cell division protein FtsA